MTTLNIDRPISTMTADELAQARRERLPIHCQTIRRRNANGGYTLSDVEELTREQLDANIINARRKGWEIYGTYFVRTPRVTVEVTYWPDLDRGYKLRFPVSELGNAVALCGWTLVNDIEKTDEIRAEIARLESFESLPIPDGKAWFARFASRIHN